MKYFTEISVVENLGVLIFGTDTSKSHWARVNLTFLNFLGNFSRHQVVTACSNFHQYVLKVRRKGGYGLDFSYGALFANRYFRFDAAGKHNYPFLVSLKPDKK